MQIQLQDKECKRPKEQLQVVYFMETTITIEDKLNDQDSKDYYGLV